MRLPRLAAALLAAITCAPFDRHCDEGMRVIARLNARLLEEGKAPLESWMLDRGELRRRIKARGLVLKRPEDLLLLDERPMSCEPHGTLACALVLQKHRSRGHYYRSLAQGDSQVSYNGRVIGVSAR